MHSYWSKELGFSVTGGEVLKIADITADIKTISFIAKIMVVHH